MLAKRRLSSTPEPDRASKRQATEEAVLPNDEDDLAEILAQIKQHEESEALARRLQDEWNQAAPVSYNDHAYGGGPSVYVDSSENDDYDEDMHDDLEDDGALARRLAEEWAEEDAAFEQNAVANPSIVGEPISVNSYSAFPNEATDEAGGSSSTTRKEVNRSELSASFSSVAADDSDSASAKLTSYRDFFVGVRNCSQCQHELLSPRGYVTYTSQTPPGSLITLLHLQCPDCDTIFCRGCLRVLPCPRGCKGETKDGGSACPTLTCCAEVRALALFEALGGFDRHYISDRTTSDSRAKAAAVKYRASQNSSVGPGGTGYGTGSCVGGHGNDYDYDYENVFPAVSYSRRRGRGSGRGHAGDEPQASSSGSVSLSEHSDIVTVRALATITTLLPDPYSDDPQIYDHLPHTSIALLLLTSQLPELLGTLLRNDSVTDWTNRSEVYNAMLSLLRRMSDCELTIEVLIRERYELKKSVGLEAWMWGDGDIVWSSANGKLTTANPLYTHFQKLTKQCEAFLAGASQILEGEDGTVEDMESIIRSTSLCGEIIAARDDLERAMKAIGKYPSNSARSQEPPSPSRPDKGKGVDKSLELERRYASECERLAFHHAAFPQVNGRYSTFNYVDILESTTSSTRNPKDRLHLIKELAVMATSLPPGVWVRVDEVRNDALKFIIAGPEGTPYAGGLFEFDCFLPLEYPHKPPQLHLRTTGGGSVRFNPNLYNNGKVCLSLLGTWPGRPEEQWTSKSTVLQVLVSIQSMIFIDLPYFNEPGCGKANASSRASIEYNKNITLQTVRWAMVEWLKDEHKNSIWADVIKTHFTLRADKIRSCLQVWARDTPQLRSFNPRFGLNLLQEFENGIQRVETWDIATAAADAAEA